MRGRRNVVSVPTRCVICQSAHWQGPRQQVEPPESMTRHARGVVARKVVSGEIYTLNNFHMNASCQPVPTRPPAGRRCPRPPFSASRPCARSIGLRNGSLARKRDQRRAKRPLPPANPDANPLAGASQRGASPGEVSICRNPPAGTVPARHRTRQVAMGQRVRAASTPERLTFHKML